MKERTFYQPKPRTDHQIIARQYFVQLILTRINNIIYRFVRQRTHITIIKIPKPTQSHKDSRQPDPIGVLYLPLLYLFQPTHLYTYIRTATTLQQATWVCIGLFARSSFASIFVLFVSDVFKLVGRFCINCIL